MSKASAAPGYAELHCLSNFSFLRGASHPEELVLTAARLGYAAIAITDECSLAGIVRANLAAWRRRGGLGPFEARLIDGMRERGYPEEFARQIFRQIEGFGDYGFPESHSASFALLVYVSAWLKCHEPAAFTCALLNSQPMGFYAPAQLVTDARRHGVEVRGVDVNASAFDCTLERGNYGAPAVRLGFRMVKGLAGEGAGRLEDHTRLLGRLETRSRDFQ